MKFKIDDRIRIKGIPQLKGTVTKIDGNNKPYTIYVVLDKKIRIAGHEAIKEGWVRPSQIDLIGEDESSWEDIWGNGAQ